jgi:hypothetical protein
MKGKLIRPALVGLVIVGALVVGGIAYANIPDGSETIHACYQKNQGALRVIDTDKAQTCSSRRLQRGVQEPSVPDAGESGDDDASRRELLRPGRD